MIVSTALRPSKELVLRAKRLTEELGAFYVPRGGLSLAKLAISRGDEAEDVLLLTDEEVKLIRADGASMFFHPSMAVVRVKRMLAGEPDTLVALAGVKPGDAVLDCTAGLGADAIVLAHAVGERGAVTALESAPRLYALLLEGLRTYESDVPQLNEAMRRVRIANTDHLPYLRQMETGSVDIVYFDPMFRQPIGESSAMSPLRREADDRPLEAEAIEQAKRVARKAVVLKEHRDSDQFARLGFAQIQRTHSKIAYGVIHIDNG